MIHDNSHQFITFKQLKLLVSTFTLMVLIQNYLFLNGFRVSRNNWTWSFWVLRR